MKNEIIDFLETYLFGIQIVITIACIVYMIKYVVNRINEIKK